MSGDMLAANAPPFCKVHQSLLPQSLRPATCQEASTDIRPSALPLWHLELLANYDDEFGKVPPEHDVVSTQGRYLITRPNTPLDVVFGTGQPSISDLQLAPSLANFKHGLRVYKYGEEVAEEYPGGQTPHESREVWRRKQAISREKSEWLRNMDEDDTCSDSDSTHSSSPESRAKSQAYRIGRNVVFEPRTISDSNMESCDPEAENNSMTVEHHKRPVNKTVRWKLTHALRPRKTQNRVKGAIRKSVPSQSRRAEQYKYSEVRVPQSVSAPFDELGSVFTTDGLRRSARTRMKKLK